jgi:hypothetical protein
MENELKPTTIVYSESMLLPESTKNLKRISASINGMCSGSRSQIIKNILANQKQ